MRIAEEQWTFIEPRPKVVLSSDDGAPTAQFGEIETSRHGSHDTQFRCVAVSWTLDPLQVRRGSSRTFRPPEIRARIHFPGDEEHGDWHGVARSVLLGVPSGVVENSLQCLPVSLPRLEPNDWQLRAIEHYLQLIRADVAARSPAGPTVIEVLTT